MKASELINIGSKKLKTNSIKSFILDSEILLSKVLNKKREEVLVDLNQKIENNKILEFLKYIDRRALKEPIAYIIQQKEFWSKNFEVNNKTLIPRPETELMLEKLINIYKKKSINILDIGTGSGCIILSLLSELKRSKGTGIDISFGALQIAKKNAKKLNILGNVKFQKKSIDSFFSQKFDLVVSNPPYIRSRDLKNLEDDIKLHEPKIALDGGNDGLDLIKKVIYKAKEILKANGRLALEISNEQVLQVSKILEKNNFRIEYFVNDYKDNIRSLISILIK